MIMKGRLPSGASLLILIPAQPSAECKKAAEVLAGELRARIALDVHLREQCAVEAFDSFDLLIQLGTLHTLPDELLEQIDPPLKIAPYPDYNEHVNLRILCGRPARILIAAGSDRALIYGVGMLFRFFHFKDDEMLWELAPTDFQPLTPLRGCFFQAGLPQDGYSRFSFGQWDHLLNDQALWGNNLAGWDSTLATPDLLDSARSHAQKTLHFSTGGDAMDSMQADYCCLQESSSDPSIMSFYESLKRLTSQKSSSPQNHSRHKPEWWIHADGWSEDELSELFDAMILDSPPAAKAVSCSESNQCFAMIKQEMPLTTPLVSLYTFSSSFSPDVLARRYFELAPLTYGALAVSSAPGDELARFAWSMLSWSPQPAADEITALYAHRYFGAAAVEDFQQAVSNLPECSQKTLDLFSQAQKNAPARMQRYAKQKQRIIINRINSFQ